METKATYYRIKDIINKIKEQRKLFKVKLKERNGKSGSEIRAHKY